MSECQNCKNLTARVAALEKALERYGRHDYQGGCPTIFDESLCTCGLAAARAASPTGGGDE